MAGSAIVDVLRQVVLPRLQRVKPSKGGYTASCPVPGHGQGRGDLNPSLTITRGDRQPVVFHCKTGCHADDIKTALIGLGVDWADVAAPPDPARPDTWMPCGHPRAAEYVYRDERGQVRYGTARCAMKGHGCKRAFAYWRPDESSRSGRRWRLSEGEGPAARRVVPHLPYRLPELLRAIELGRNVWVVEGEKDADRLAGIRIAATCNDGGAGRWNDEYANWLAGADVIIVADRDEPGWKHAETVVETLLPLARSIEVVRAAEGKDAADHIGAGLHVGQFVTLAIPMPAPTAVPGCPDCAAEACP